MPLSLLNHSELALFAQHMRILTSARSTGFYDVWVCINSVRVRVRVALISAATLSQRLIMDQDSYFHNRILRWAGHVARMPMTYDSGAAAVADRLVAHSGRMDDLR
jgi:hypothetical protein